MRIVHLMIALCFVYGMDVNAADEVVLGAMFAPLSAAQLRSFKEDALLGSGEAAWRLALYYRIEKLDIERQLYWVRIGAENGNADCQYEMWANYRSRDKNLRRRAIFWLRKAAAQKLDVAIRAAERCLDRPDTTDIRSECR